MKYITDAAKEYAKKHTKDAYNFYLNFPDYDSLFESLANIIDDFDKENGDNLWVFIHDNEIEEDDLLNTSRQGIGSKLALEYMKYLAKQNKRHVRIETNNGVKEINSWEEFDKLNTKDDE